VRDKARELCELLSDSMMLEREREFARQTRDKLAHGSMGSAGTSHYSGGMGGMGGPPTSMGSNTIMTSGGPSAGPASGKYGGFGSEDIKKLGYNREGQFSAPYDPYTKGQSAPSQSTHKHNNTSSKTEDKKDKKADKSKNKKKNKKSKKSKKKKKRDSSYDSESDSDDSDSDSDSESEEKDSSEEEPKKKKKKGKLTSAPKSQR